MHVYWSMSNGFPGKKTLFAVTRIFLSYPVLLSYKKLIYYYSIIYK